MPSTVPYSKDQSRKSIRDFPGGPMVNNPPSNAGNVDLIPSLGTRSHMPGAAKPTWQLEADSELDPTCLGQLSPHMAARGNRLTTAKTQCSQNFTRERRQDEVVK